MAKSIMITYGDFRVELVKAESALVQRTMDAALNNLISAAHAVAFPEEASKSILEMKFIPLAEKLRQLESL